MADYKETLDFHKLVQANATRFMRGEVYTCRLIQVSNGKKELETITTSLDEDDLTRRLLENNLLKIVPEIKLDFNGLLKTVNDYLPDVVYVDFTPTTEELKDDIKLLFLDRNNKTYRLKINGQIVTQENELVADNINELEEKGIVGDFFVPLYNSNSGATADRYMGFKVDPRATEESWINDIAEILGIRMPKGPLTFKEFAVSVGRLFQSATHSITTGHEAEAFIIVMGKMGKVVNQVTGKTGNCFDGYLEIGQIEYLHILKKMLPDVQFREEPGKIFAIDPETGMEREVMGRPVMPVRWTGQKGVAGYIGPKKLEWYKEHFNVIELKRDDPRAQAVLDYWYDHGKKEMMPGFEDVQMIKFYTNTPDDPVSFVADMDIVKINFDVQTKNVMNILSFAHQKEKHEIKGSGQFADKFRTVSNKFVEAWDKAVIREIWRDLNIMFNPAMSLSNKISKSEYFSDELRSINLEAFIEDATMYKSAFRNQLKKYSTLVSKRNPLLAGTCNIILPDFSKLVALVEGKEPVLSGNKVMNNELEEGEYGIEIKHPTVRQDEYTIGENVKLEGYKQGVKDADYSQLGKEAILESVEQLPPCVMLVNSTLEYMVNMAGLDYDGDKLMMYTLPRDWKAYTLNIKQAKGQKKDTVKINPKVFGPVETKNLPTVCYGYYGHLMHRMEIVYDSKLHKDSCIIPMPDLEEGELPVTSERLHLKFVPTEREIYRGKYIDHKDGKCKDIEIDFTEIEGDLLCEISRIDLERGKTYLYIKDEPRDEIGCIFDNVSMAPAETVFGTPVFTLNPLSIWAAMKTLIKFNAISVGQYANCNTIVCQFMREAMLSLYYKDTRGFEGFSPVFAAIKKYGQNLLGGGKDAENLKGLTKKVIPAAVEQGFDKVIITTRSELFKMFESALKAKFSPRSLNELFIIYQAINFIGSDDTIGAKKTATQVRYSETWKKSMDSIKMGSMLGMRFELVRDSERDQIIPIYDIDVRNAAIKKKNATQIYQIPLIVEDEGMNHVRYLGDVVAGMLQRFMPENTHFKNIADVPYQKLKGQVPVSLVAYAKSMYFSTLSLGRMDENNMDMDEWETTDDEGEEVRGELKQEVDAHRRAARRVIKCAIGNTITKGFELAGLSLFKTALTVKYFSDKVVSGKQLGKKTNPTSFYSILEEGTAEMFLQILQNKKVYSYLEPLKPFVMHPDEPGALVEVKNGIVNSQYTADVDDGIYETVSEEIKINKDRTIKKYSIICNVKFTKNSDITNCYCLYSSKKDAQENLINAKDKIVHIVAKCDKQHFKAAVVDENSNIITELPEPYWTSQWDKEVFVKFLNTLRNCKINTVYQDKSKCLFTLEVNEDIDVTEKQEEEILSIFDPAKRKAFRKDKVNKDKKEERADQYIDLESANDRVEEDVKDEFTDYEDYKEDYNEGDDEFIDFDAF